MWCVIFNHFCKWTKSTGTTEDSLKMNKELWFHSQYWQRFFPPLWNILTSSTAHPASNSTSTRGKNLLPCCLLVVIYIKCLCKIIQIKFPTVCISFILVSSLLMTLTAAVLQITCDRDRAELLHQMLILLQHRWVCHFPVVTIQTRLPFRTHNSQISLVSLHVLPIYCAHATCPVSGADYTLSDTCFKEHCLTVQQNSVQKLKVQVFQSHKFWHS